MNVKIIKENQISIGYVPNVSDIIEMPDSKFRIVGKRVCNCCGHKEDVKYDTEKSDTIVLIPTLK